MGDFYLEVSEMCNLGLAVEKKGIESSLLQSIKNLMETMKLSSQQAMDALKIHCKPEHPDTVRL